MLALIILFIVACIIFNHATNGINHLRDRHIKAIKSERAMRLLDEARARVACNRTQDYD